MKTYGYARVSTQEQNEDRQMIALENKGVQRENIFLDKQSGKDFNRPEYQRMVNTLREGDMLCILSIDRLGRNYQDIREEWRMLTKEKKVDICVLNMPLLDTSQFKDLLGTFLSDLVLEILGFVSELERDNIRQRQAEGIAAAKLKGIHLGRPLLATPENFEETVRLWQSGEIKQEEAIRRSGVSRSTFFRMMKEYRKNNREEI